MADLFVYSEFQKDEIINGAIFHVIILKSRWLNFVIGIECSKIIMYTDIVKQSTTAFVINLDSVDNPE